jgi:DNA-directed RNA polymerase subunit RPC12/RpoP
MIRIVKCNRCGKEWATKKKGGPKTCRHCHSPYWNKKRKYPVKK